MTKLTERLLQITLGVVLLYITFQLAVLLVWQQVELRGQIARGNINAGEIGKQLATCQQEREKKK